MVDEVIFHIHIMTDSMICKGINHDVLLWCACVLWQTVAELSAVSQSSGEAPVDNPASFVTGEGKFQTNSSLVFELILPS